MSRFGVGFACLVCFSASAFGQIVPAVPRGPTEQDQAEARRLHATPHDDPTMGPLDPGPYPYMPGFFSRRATNLNYRETPFFNNSGNGGYYGGVDNAYGFGGGQQYYPGVYPYYDASAHYQWYLAYRRERKLKTQSDILRDEGMEHFKDSEYSIAAVRLLGAAELDAGDAASRIHAGHALFALRRYEDSVKLLRRAVELQPALVFMSFDPREDYGNRREFDDHLATLAKYVQTMPQNVAAQTLLGYMLFFTDGPDRARPVLERASAAAGRDSLIDRLLEVAAKSSVDEAVARVSGSRDTRTYDQMGIKPQAKQTYDSHNRPVTGEKIDDKKKAKGRRI